MCMMKNKGRFLYNKSTDALISKFVLVRNSTYFGQFPCLSSGVIHCTFGTGICYTGLTTACVRDQDGTSSSCVCWFYCKEIYYDARSYERKKRGDFFFQNVRGSVEHTNIRTLCCVMSSLGRKQKCVSSLIKQHSEL